MKYGSNQFNFRQNYITGKIYLLPTKIAQLALLWIKSIKICTTRCLFVGHQTLTVFDVFQVEFTFYNRL